MKECRETRERLVAGGPRAEDRGARRHLRECAACAAFAARLEHAGELLRRRSRAEPGPEFASRVVASLPGTPDLLGWAALRLMPAAVALALVLTAWCVLATPTPSALLEESASDDPLAWVIEGIEEEG